MLELLGPCWRLNIVKYQEGFPAYRPEAFSQRVGWIIMLDVIPQLGECFDIFKRWPRIPRLIQYELDQWIMLSNTQRFPGCAWLAILEWASFVDSCYDRWRLMRCTRPTVKLLILWRCGLELAALVLFFTWHVANINPTPPQEYEHKICSFDGLKIENQNVWQCSDMSHDLSTDQTFSQIWFEYRLRME